MGLAIKLLLALTLCSNLAYSAEFSWLPNTESNITGYKIYYGTERNNMNEVVDVGLPAVVNGRVHGEITGLDETIKRYYAVVAYTDTEESEISGIVVYGTGISHGTTATEGQVDLVGNGHVDLFQ